MKLQDLYQEIIVDHKRSPRNFRCMPDSTHSAEGFNPLCGDRLTLFLKTRDGIVDDVSFQGDGCAISVASASLMTERVKGMPAAAAEQLFQQMHDMLTGRGDVESSELGKLAALSGVRAYPTRVKCATLCWHTLRAALQGNGEKVSTE